MVTVINSVWLVNSGAVHVWVNWLYQFGSPKIDHKNCGGLAKAYLQGSLGVSTAMTNLGQSIGKEEKTTSLSTLAVVCLS